MNFRTLKFRINVVTIIFSLIIFIISSLIMYSILSQSISSRIEEEYTNNLNMIRLSIENDISSLNSVSLLFAPTGNLGETIISFDQTSSLGEKSILLSKIYKDMRVISSSNPNISSCVFFTSSDYSSYISTIEVEENIDFEQMPLLFKTDTIDYYLLHKSAQINNNIPVLALKRKIYFGYREPAHVYVEYNFENTVSLLNSKFNSDGFIYLILNGMDEIIYSTNEQEFQTGSSLATYDTARQFVQLGSKKDNGWRIVTLAQRHTINDIKKKLILSYMIRYPIFLVLGIAFSFVLFELINKPLQKFREGVKQIEKGDFNTLIAKTNIHEFDRMIAQIHNAKLRISVLLDEVSMTEQKRVFAEVSRLRAQINPHFLLNTLNTVHWMAIEKQQPDIDNIIQALNKILAYNLKKDSYETTIKEEMEATDNYIKLQQLKYDFDFFFVNNASNEAMQYCMPRFILQPLVENSILHNENKHLSISILLQYIEEGLILIIKDNGCISEEVLERLKHLKSNPENLGIGLSYVLTALNTYYKRDDLITFDDVEGGLQISILLPFEGGTFNDKSIGR
ncbi:MAG: histidine kinase [Vallitaleaceae bacterium]|nr:histidine kinase [Vallitaleaceae bacterium]